MACKCNKDKFKEEFLKKLKESRRNIDNKLENPLFIAGYIECVDYLEDIFNYAWQEHMEGEMLSFTILDLINMTMKELPSPIVKYDYPFQKYMALEERVELIERLIKDIKHSTNYVGDLHDEYYCVVEEALKGIRDISTLGLVNKD